MTLLILKKVDIAEYEYCYSVAMIPHALITSVVSAFVPKNND